MPRGGARDRGQQQAAGRRTKGGPVSAGPLLPPERRRDRAAAAARASARRCRAGGALPDEPPAGARPFPGQPRSNAGPVAVRLARKCPRARQRARTRPDPGRGSPHYGGRPPRKLPRRFARGRAFRRRSLSSPRGGATSCQGNAPASPGQQGACRQGPGNQPASPVPPHRKAPPSRRPLGIVENGVLNEGASLRAVFVLALVANPSGSRSCCTLLRSDYSLLPLNSRILAAPSRATTMWSSTLLPSV